MLEAFPPFYGPFSPRPAWYKALMWNRNLSIVFESRSAPSLASLNYWSSCIEAFASTPPFEFTVRVPERMCSMHKQMIDRKSARIFEEAMAQRSRSEVSICISEEIRKAYQRAGCNVGHGRRV